MATKGREPRCVKDGARGKPDGGFCLVPGRALMAAWWAYRRGIVRLLDLRVWFGSLELVARRCGLKPGQRPRFTVEELHRLTGGAGGEHLRKAIQRLQAAGLLIWSETAIQHGDSIAGLSAEDAAAFEELLTTVINHERKVPVPRRLIRLIAGGARRVVIATMLAHLLRCLYYRAGQCVPTGRCKASWISDVFGVDLRNVKAARQHLVQIGWLIPKRVSQRSLNRWGSEIEINLRWAGAAFGHETGSPPPKAFSTAGSPPPLNDTELSLRSKNHKPAKRGPTGVYEQEGRRGEPRIAHVVHMDLRDSRRLARLFEQAKASRLVDGSECDRLRFFGAAQHALSIGTKNPCGLFAAIVRRKLWAFITQADEDEARQRLMRLDDESKSRCGVGKASSRPCRYPGQGNGKPVNGGYGAMPRRPDKPRIHEAVLRSLGLLSHGDRQSVRPA
jgi:hypothetical protein